VNVLIVEDDENKKKRINDYLLSSSEILHIDWARSFQSGVTQILNGRYDLILLDMTIPTYDVTPSERGGRIRAFGGKEILAKMRRAGITVPVIVVTQFESFGEGASVIGLRELSEQLQKEFPEIYRGAVYYNAAQEDWKTVLDAKLRSEKLK